ncbi:cyclic nucleotide-binding protein [Desulfurispirillum indicum S5]|uniref:Cyclic nucleotide-binding protein n=1 Tax=Desulfurispirillum indicum (strain ATCC BAA-1389 / DSM 22839 / S5) TaxID=653733 RepID=E6W2I3_DESIS|nr:Crp/Fnr family transcriptional regulator [Desulfurispirillum indicum]ADU66733.1 cyclic nucleotide-binding protein [Desulfurispirillum indicum S5]
MRGGKSDSGFHTMKNMAELPADLLDTYLERCQRRTADKNGILFGPHEAPDFIYMVLQGSVRIFLSCPNGKEFTISVLQRGGVYSGHARGFGMAMAAQTQIALVHVSDFREIMEQNPAFMLSVVAILGDALKNTVNIIENLAFREVDKRLMHYLAEAIRRSGEPVREGILLDMGLTQEQIATAIGSTRQTVSSQLRQLENKGILRTRSRKILILQPAYFLESTADSPSL